MMILSLAIILAIGWLGTGNFTFAAGQFWFIAGALLLITQSLVDQPNFSKDANIFLNGLTAFVSLFTLTESQRIGMWNVFLAWSLYLVISSFILMVLRSRQLALETKIIQFFSRLNRTIGCPESIFSAFFLWGALLQFGSSNSGMVLNALFLFWSIFMILNVPAIARTVSQAFEDQKASASNAGLITSIQSPRIAEARLSADLPDKLDGRRLLLKLGEEQVAEGILFEDRTVCGLRRGRIAITDFGAKWNKVSNKSGITLELTDTVVPNELPIGVVSVGTTIGKLVFEVDPRTALHAGEVVEVKTDGLNSYYQIVAATINEVALAESNASQNVRVTAGQLGHWNSEKATFDPIDWVAPAGEIVSVSRGESIGEDLPKDCCLIGHVPNSKFPVHVHVSDTITHNTALIGVTGSGKSYLAFHLIESYIQSGVKVIILDLTRQHWQFLQHLKPVALKESKDVKAWLASDSPLAIHQYGKEAGGFPLSTANFAQECFDWLQSNTKLRAGVDEPAKVCIVMEEAHSLIPEWSQVAHKDDTQHVNRTARIVLQGRKYGLGTLLITQRTANVTKTILNQCNTIFALRSFDQTGLDFLRNYLGEEYSQAISTLPDRTAILVGKASSSARPIILKVSNFGERWNNNNSTPNPADNEEPKGPKISVFD